MGQQKDLVGRRFTKLVVLEWAGRTKYRQSIWRCQCDCGNVCEVNGNYLVTGDTGSCGCNKGAMGQNQTHGLSGTPEHLIWQAMKTRCANRNGKQWLDYGGRGITVCQEWSDDFVAFLRDMGPRPSPKHSIDRIDNDKGYGPANCRWATPLEQSRNRRANVPVIRSDGVRFGTMAEAAESVGLNQTSIRNALHRGRASGGFFWKPADTQADPTQ